MIDASFVDERLTIHVGDCLDALRAMPDSSVHCCVTSPPYFGLRDYEVEGQIGLEQTPVEYVEKLVSVFREVRRVLRDDGTLWLNLGDSYAGSGRGAWNVDDDVKRAAGVKETYSPRVNSVKPYTGLASKQLIGIPWRVAFALQADGWYLRQDIIWSKPNPMPESVTDRCTKAHEYVFLLSKSARYFYDAEAIKEESIKGANGSEFHTGKTGEHQLGRSSKKTREQEAAYFGSAPTNLGRCGDNENGTRNRRSVWSISTQPYPEPHFAVMPSLLAETCILAGCPKGGTVIDPFGGAGTTALAALRHQRRSTLIELNPKFADMARQRILSEWGAIPRVKTREFAPSDDDIFLM